MNESNEDDEPRVEQSLCWTCKHGMCIREVHQEHLLNLGGLPGMQPGPPRGEDPFGIQGDMPFNNQQGEGIEGQIVEHEHIRSVCFWRPSTIKDAPPLLIGFIKQCNRFEKQT